MSVVHLHLLLSHVPVIAVVVVVALLVAALLRASDELARFALWMVVAIGAIAGGVFLTGELTEEAIEELPGISQLAIEAHERAGTIAMWVAVAYALAASALLLAYRRRSLGRRAIALSLVLAVAATTVFAWTANSGGKIRHTEIAASAAASPDENGEDR